MSLAKIGAVWLIVGLLIGVIAGYGVGYVVYDPRISRLQSDVTSLQDQIDTLNSTLLNTQEELAEAQNNITSLQGNITSLETQLEEAQAELMPGRVPILTVGDWWIMETVVNQTTYTLTANVTAEGTDYYIMFSSYDPPFQMRINRTDWIDKSTLNPVRMWGYGNYTYDTTVIPYTFNITIRYIYEGGVPYPLIVGKELNMTETMTYNTTMMGTTYTYLMNMSFTVKVETIENVTVTAGTFPCFRMDMRNATSGDLIYTMWYSDEVKYYVKYVDYSTTPETTYELKAYSVQ